MTPSNPPNSSERGSSRPGAAAPADHSPAPPSPGELPPKAVSVLALGRLARHQEIARRVGARAEVETLRTQLRLARQRRDADAEAAVKMRLARCLMARGSGWAEAIRLARQSLLLREEPQLREELSAWFASLAQFKLAAVTLEPLLERPLPAARRAALGQRVAVLAARAGEARRAAVALKWAAEAEPHVALAPEMVAVLHDWAPDEIGKRVACRALLEASRRHAAQDAGERAFDCALRAFTKDPTHLAAAQELADRFAAKGNRQVADEVWRQCLLASQHRHPQADDVTWRRITEALRDEQPLLALGAALDAQQDQRLDADALWDVVSAFDGAGAEGIQPTFDGLLAATQNAGWLAARLRLQATEAPSEARWWQALARWYTDVLDDVPRACEAWGEALVRDPQEPSAAQALWTLTQTLPSRDPSPLVWALRRAARQGPQAWRQRALEQLIRLAERRVVKPVVGVWAAEQLRRIVPLPGPIAAALEVLRSQCEPASAEGDWASMPDDELRSRLADLLEDPGSCESALAALGELSRREPTELRWYVEQARLLKELGRLDAVEALWRQALERGAPEAASREALVELHLERRAPQQALTVIEEHAEDELRLSTTRAVLASLHGTRRQRVEALAALARAPAHPLSQRSLLLAVASCECLALGERELAREYAQLACRSDSESVRAMVCTAEARAEDSDRLARVALEEASEKSWPRPSWCRHLSAIANSSSEAERRSLWLRRWVALEPGSLEASRRLLSQLSESGDASEIVAAADWLLSMPRPLTELADELLAVADHLAELDAARCRGLVQRLLGLIGLERPAVVERFATLAERLREPRLHVARLERMCALQADSIDHPSWLQEIAAWHARIGDGDAAVEALWRARQAGADAATVLAQLGSLPPRTGSDAQLVELQLRAELARAVAPEAVSELAMNYRELGAAFWDLAGDRERAMEAFVQGADLEPATGDATLVRDLIAFFGYPDSVGALRELALRREQPRERGRLLLEAAWAAQGDGFEEEAKRFAEAVLRCNPSSTEALQVVEACSNATDSELLEQCYARVDEAALGCFGVRALHYRAARRFEVRGEWNRAFRHAQVAFQAAPSEGRMLTYLSELAHRTGHAPAAVSNLRRVAQAAGSPSERKRWLQWAMKLEALEVAATPEGASQQTPASFRPPLPAPVSETVASAPHQQAADSSRQQSDAVGAAEGKHERLERALKRLNSAEQGALVAAEELEALLSAEPWEAAVRLRVFSDLRQVYVREGAGERLERLLTGALEANWLGQAQRSEAARELAELLDRRGAHLAALDVLGMLEGWGDLQLRDVRRCISIARTAGEKPRELSYLLRLERATDELGERRATLRRLAELQRAQGQREAARESLFALLEVAAGDPLALEALMEEAEREAQPAPWWTNLEGHLRQWKGPADVARRLARLYLQQGHQVQQARLLVEQVLEQHPADVELWETVADVAAAEQDWSASGHSYWRAARECRQARRAAQLAAKAARAFLAAGELTAAEEVLTHEGSYPQTASLVELWVELSRRREDDAALGEALERLSDLSVGPASERAAPLIEAASVALRVGDWERALERARRAARLAPTDARAQLQAKGFEYRQRGPGTREEALRTISELRGVRCEAPELVELKAFLLAEALDQRAAQGLGLRELRDAEARVGALPLIALGLAERLAMEDGLEALKYYQRALRGDLRQLREPSAIARAAAQLAERCERPEVARLFVELSQLPVSGSQPALKRLPPTSEPWREGAGFVQSQPARPAVPSRPAKPAVPSPTAGGVRPIGGSTRIGMGPLLVKPTAELPRGEVRLAEETRKPATPNAKGELTEEAEPLITSIDVSPFEAAQRALEAVSIPPSQTPPASSQPARRLSTPPPKPERQRAPGSGAAEAPRAHHDQTAPSESRVAPVARAGMRGALELDEEPFSADEASGMEAALRRVAEQAALLSGRSFVLPASEGEQLATQPGDAEARHKRFPSLPPGSNPDALARRFAGAAPLERQLLAELCAGELQAGMKLLELLDAEAGRQRDVVEVLRAMVVLAVGEPLLLERLRLAAQRDNDSAFATALLHAAEALSTGTTQCSPPPLEPQPVQSEVVLGLLRVGAEPALEALGLLWQHAAPLFRDDVDSGRERRPLPDEHPLWMATFSISRLLGASRLRLWVHDAPAPVRVILEQPPGLMLFPGVDWQSTTFLFELGQALLETRPELVLVRSLPKARLQALMAAVLAAFGPPRRLEGDITGIAELAERFWELLPPRVQRRLGELCEQPDAFEYEQIQAAARAARRRCGLFVSGDLAVALREVARAEGIDLEGARRYGEVAKVCQQHPAIADLVRLATSSEYAEARWRVDRVVATDRQR